MFDRKDLGPGATPRVLPDGHIVFHRGTGWPPRVIFDDNDLGPGEQFDPATPTLHASLVVAERETISTRIVDGRMLEDLIGFARSAHHVIHDGLDFEQGNEPMLSGDHVVFVRDLGPGLSPQFAAAPLRESGSVLRN